LREGGYQGPLTWIPNGVQLDVFSPAAGQQTRKAHGLSGQIVGLIGNHERWSELERVLDVARLLSDTSAIFLIVGRGAAVSRAADVVRAEGLTNVRFVGFVPQSHIAAYFSAIDVGLCPYPRDAAADARCPLRLLSYSAAGSAVVCTQLEEVRRMGFPNVILVGDSAVDMAMGVREALRRPRQRPPHIAEYDIRALARRYEQVLIGDSAASDPVDIGLDHGRPARA
jgi:glycosyltransferase involved in cell wall biosynthesis